MGVKVLNMPVPRFMFAVWRKGRDAFSTPHLPRGLQRYQLPWQLTRSERPQNDEKMWSHTTTK